MKNKKKTVKRLIVSAVVTLSIVLGLVVTTYAYLLDTELIENNLFKTGMVEINLNDGKPIIEPDEFLFEPGMTVVKDFFLKNDSTWEVYFRIYFKDVQGDLADILNVTIAEGDTVIYKGTIAELNRENVKAADDSLDVGEVREFTMTFHYPEEKGNEGQNKEASFFIAAEAVQTKNNPDKLFD